jgi:hypothetical protein
MGPTGASGVEKRPEQGVGPHEAQRGRGDERNAIGPRVHPRVHLCREKRAKCDQRNGWKTGQRGGQPLTVTVRP